ncbi:hypothetical protein GGGNBK_12090 [Sporosarcina sp. ANT_H38]
MKEYDLELHRIARRGSFGINGKCVLTQLGEWPHEVVMDAVNSIRKHIERLGMDFEFENSNYSVVRLAVDLNNKYQYFYWKYYKTHMTDDHTVVELDRASI